MKSYLNSISVCFYIAVSACMSLNAQQQKEWIPVDPEAPPGTPVVLNVLVADPLETEIEVTVPGFWAEEVIYGGKSYFRLSYPAIEFRGKGFPANKEDPGWWDFPQVLKQPKRNPAPFVAGVGSKRTYFFPESALGANPQTAADMIELGIDPEGARPGLPRLRSKVAMSRKNTPATTEARLEPGKLVTIPLTLSVAPAGFEGGDADNGFRAPDLIDTEFYSNFKGQYIGSEPLMGEIGGMGGALSGATLAIPVFTLINPSTIQTMPIFRVYLKHLEGAEDFECPMAWDYWYFVQPYLNGEALRESLTAKGLKIEASRSARYLILCPKDWRPTLENFAVWKQSKGLNVDFVYVGADGDLPANRDDIDEYLEAYFQKHYCHGVYVLICGDQNVIPAGRSSRIIGTPDGTNADSDHVYEVLGSDRFPSLYVGRLSANSTSELKNQLDKILKYEHTPVSGTWPTIATLCANSQMDDDDFGVNADWPTKYSLAVEQIAHWPLYFNPPTFETLHAGAASSSVVRAVNQDVLDALDAGRGQILYRGHGSESDWSYGWDGSGSSTSTGTGFSATVHVDKLDNPVQPIVYAINCLNNRINQNDSIGEHWMSLEDAGAVAHFGATVTSGTSENHERAKGIFLAQYWYGYTRLAPMLGQAESISYTTTGGGGWWDSNTFAYMLLGDPEMEIRHRSVPKATASSGLVATVTQAEGGVRIRVTDVNGFIQPGAFVNLTSNDGRRFNGFANTDGEVIVNAIDAGSVSRLDLILDGFSFTVEYLQAPMLEAVGFVPGGGFKIRLKKAPQGVFRIFGSSDLESWQPLGLATQVGTNQEFVDSAAPSGSVARRFYRAVQQP